MIGLHHRVIQKWKLLSESLCTFLTSCSNLGGLNTTIKKRMCLFLSRDEITGGQYQLEIVVILCKRKKLQRDSEVESVNVKKTHLLSYSHRLPSKNESIYCT